MGHLDCEIDPGEEIKRSSAVAKAVDPVEIHGESMRIYENLWNIYGESREKSLKINDLH